MPSMTVTVITGASNPPQPGIPGRLRQQRQIALAKDQHNDQGQHQPRALHKDIGFQYAHLVSQPRIHYALKAHGRSGNQ